MKIQSSDISYASQSQLSHSSKETLYTLDEKGNILHKDQQKLTVTQSQTMDARFQTKPDYTVEIKDQSEARISQETEATRDSSVDLNDDFEKNMYLGSILDWAADTIDFFVSAFEDQQATQLSKPTTGLEPVQGVQNLESRKPLEHQVDFYRAMAAELRNKADALRPELPTPGANRLRRTSQVESERTMVQTTGAVTTSDGREIQFSLDIDMQRKAESHRVEAFTIIDPLVINFSGTSAQLSNETMSFDLNGDGTAENIARLESGSGYLSLDINGNGVINDGRELFGPSTGNGFNELSFYDQDNNQWIDENDEIFEKLLVWFKDDAQNDVLKKLSDTGIGAIHIGSVDSDFSLKDNFNETLGQVSATGIALTEAGEVKTIQQIDLVV